MRRKLILILFLCILCVTDMKAYTIDSNNNPGENYNGAATGGGTTSTTYWPYDPIKTIRIRVFRNGTYIKDSYYTLAETSSGCYGSINGATICETSSYNYSSISEVDATCSTKNISLGCIASTNLTSTWNLETYNGAYLNDYLTNNDYTQLKSILSHMGYDDNNFNNNDVVIIEPATVVYCAGTPYFGTSTALMKKNVSYNSSTNNLCSANDSWDGWTFYNVYNSMSQALKVTTNAFNINAYSGFGYFKYDVSGMAYVEPEPEPEEPEINENMEKADGLRILPNYISYRGNNVATMFYLARSMSRNGNAFGLDYSIMNSHVMKNSEWGAVAYLSQSKYGKYGNTDYTGANKEIYMNNSKLYYTGKSAGSVSAEAVSEGSYSYDHASGIGASTTGNIYGIYDMSGGTWEYVMAVFSNSNGDIWTGNSETFNFGFTGLVGQSGTLYTGLDFPLLKYFDVYKATSGINIDVTTACNGTICYGHALSETVGWYDDSINSFMSATYPTLVRGGNRSGHAGVFTYSKDTAPEEYVADTFRVVLTPQ